MSMHSHSDDDRTAPCRDAGAKAPGQPAQPSKRCVHFSLAAILGIGAALRFWGLARQSFWYDEVNGIRIAAYGFGEIIRRLPADASPPLYYFLLHVWLRVAGSTGETAARSFAAAAGLALLPVLYAVGTRLFGRRAGLGAALLGALAPFHIYYSQEARMYSLLALLGLLSFAALHRALERNRRRDWIAYGTWTLLTCYCHNYGAFIAVAECVFVATQVRQRPNRLRPFLITVAIMVLLYLPWLPVTLAQLRGGAVAGWIPPFRPGQILATFKAYAGMHMLGARSVTFWIGLCAFLFCLGAGLVHAGPRDVGSRFRLDRSPGALLVLCYLLVTLAAPMLVSIFKPVYLPNRYSIAAWPAFVLLLGKGLARLRRRALLIPTLSGLLFVTGVSLYWHYFMQEKAPDRETAALLRRELRPGDLVVFAPHWAGVSILHYLDEAPKHLGFPAPALAERAHQSEADPVLERQPREMLELTLQRLGPTAGKLVLVTFTGGFWERDIARLQALYDQAFNRCAHTRNRYISITVYARPEAAPGEGRDPKSAGAAAAATPGSSTGETQVQVR